MLRQLRTTVITAGLLTLGAFAAQAGQVTFTITNAVQGADGMWIMRPWVGISDGTFATYTVGQTASAPVIHLAEDGVTGDVSAGASNLFGPSNACAGVSYPGYAGDGSDCLYSTFKNAAGSYSQTTIGGPTKPGQTITGTLAADPTNGKSQYLNYLVMAIPSNDTFFGTPTGGAIQLFNGGVFNNGNGDIILTLTAADLLDAGAESDNSCGAIAFLCGTPGTGVQNSPLHPITQFTMFNSSTVNGSNMFGGHLNTFENINNIFADPNTVIATVDISYTSAPEPASFALFGVGAMAAAVFSRLRRKGCV